MDFCRNGFGAHVSFKFHHGSIVNDAQIRCQRNTNWTARCIRTSLTTKINYCIFKFVFFYFFSFQYGPRYNYDTTDQSLLLGSAFVSTVIIIVPMGIFIEKYGFVRLMAIVSFANYSIMFLLTPLAAATSFRTLYAVRFALGFFSVRLCQTNEQNNKIDKILFANNTQGGMSGVLQQLMVHWVPPKERGQFTSMFFGIDVGHIVASVMSAYLIETYGWKWACYVPALLGFCFTFVTPWTIYDRPSQHPRITADERSYIEKSLRGVNTGPKVWCWFKYTFISEFDR